MSEDAPSMPAERPIALRLARAAALYTLAVVAATWPFVKTFTTSLPSLTDPLQHLWIMRWYKTALAEGRSPLRSPELQYPLGAPIANFSPLHLQSLLYLVFSWLVENDILVFNTIWLIGFVSTGVGTYVLARWALGSERGALLAGLLAMLSGPMMVHSHAHLELMFVGGFPLFMLAWICFLEKPSAARLAAAIAGLAFITASAAYYLVFTSVAGGLYLLHRTIRARREGDKVWIFARVPWLVGFVAGCAPVLLLLFSAQLMTAAEGHTLTRDRTEFDHFRAPWWSYFVPAPGNRLAGLLLSSDPYAAAQISGEGIAYLGVVTLGLLGVAAFTRVPVRQGRFWWFLLAAMVVLSLGSFGDFFGAEVSLPAGWIWDWYPPFHLIRVPARFKFFAAVAAAVLAGAGYVWIDSRLKAAWAKGLVLAGLAGLALLDLAHANYENAVVPALPKGYTWLLEHDPEAAWVDAPQMGTGNPSGPNSPFTYWQALHRGRTTAGYSGHMQWEADNLLTWNSPFFGERLSHPDFLDPGQPQTFDIVGTADAYAYTYTYLHEFGLPYVVLHKWSDGMGPFNKFAHLRRILEPSKIYEDDLLVIYERDRLPAPEKPAAVCSKGWLTRADVPGDGYVRPVSEEAVLTVYVPKTAEPMTFGVRARSLRDPRKLRVEAGDQVLAEWTVRSSDQDIWATPAFRLPPGLHRVKLVSEGSVRAGKHKIHLVSEPVSLLVSGICLRLSTPEERLALDRAEGKVTR